MKNSRDGDSDDLELWRRVTGTVKPYHQKARVKEREKEKGGRPVSPAPLASARTSPPSPKKPVPAAAGFDAATDRRLKRGQLVIEGKIDLHGLSQERAFEALSRFILSARSQGKRNIMVVTGKGLRTGGGILRRMLPVWLSEGILGAQVLACAPARPKDGGDGAFYVRLRKKDV